MRRLPQLPRCTTSERSKAKGGRRRAPGALAAGHPTSHTRHGDNQAGNYPRQTTLRVLPSPERGSPHRATALVPPQRRTRMMCSWLRPYDHATRTTAFGLAWLMRTVVSSVAFGPRQGV
jgi:hypothetical protein